MGLIRGANGIKKEDEINNDLPGIINEGGEIEVEEETVETETPEAETKEDKEIPKFVFKSQEELDNYVKSKNKIETTKVDEEENDDDVDEFKDVKIFDGHIDPETGKWIGEKPGDWNDLARRILKFLSPKEYAPKILKELNKMTAKEKREIENIDAQFDLEYDELSAQGLIPSRTTKEGKDVNAQISKIGAENGLTSISAAYNLWKKIPKDQGGGLDYKPTKEEKPNNPSKEASRLIGNSNKGGQKVTTNKRSYSQLHNSRSIDELIEE